MEQFLERVMNFINENTMLLIVICIFLIIILIIYLIDNTIKTRRLEKAELDKKNNPEPKVMENIIPEKEETKETETEEKQPIKEQKEEPVIPVVEEEPTSIEPVVDSNIDELLNKDYSINNEIVNNISEEEIKEVPKSKYNNDKKLSDIFGKKEEPIKNIETTQDFSNELDKILKKLNDEDKNVDNSSLEDTSNYTNMF